jgi:hypothetical protein
MGHWRPEWDIIPCTNSNRFRRALTTVSLLKPPCSGFRIETDTWAQKYFVVIEIRILHYKMYVKYPEGPTRITGAGIGKGGTR